MPMVASLKSPSKTHLICFSGILTVQIYGNYIFIVILLGCLVDSMSMQDLTNFKINVIHTDNVRNT